MEIEIALRLYQDEIADKNIQLIIEPFDHRFSILVDHEKLRQILVNLLSNAVKFAPQSGRIRVAAEIDEDRACVISVQDNGNGMSEDEIAQALLPFGKGEGGLKRNFDGAGLGLPITNALVALHDGQLTIESARGVGTLVAVKFPPDRVKFVGAPGNIIADNVVPLAGARAG